MSGTQMSIKFTQFLAHIW